MITLGISQYGKNLLHFMLHLMLQHDLQHKPALLQPMLQQKLMPQFLRYTQTRAGGRLAQTRAARSTPKLGGGATGAFTP